MATWNSRGLRGSTSVSYTHLDVYKRQPMGILAGKRAGMKVCAIDDAYSRKQESQKRELADWYILDYTQLAEKETRREEKA